MKRFCLVVSMMLLVAASPAIAQTSLGKKHVLDDTLSTLMRARLSGMWWRNPKYITLLELTEDQQKRMDEVFQARRIKLIDLNATVEKEEATLEPLLQADRLDEAKTLAQIDRIAEARAELEKGNARMLLGIRMILTAAQWDRLQSGKVKADAPVKVKPLKQ